MKKAVLYARVSSKEQEQEGYSIPAQLKFLREYAHRNGILVAQEFVDVETAKISGRKNFGEMLNFLQKSSDCKAVLVEKTDRLYRNIRDYATLDELDIEIHFAKEGEIICKDSKSQAKFLHGIRVLMAKNYSENLSEEVQKGMKEKAAQGIYPSRPPFGYRNNKAERTIEVDPERSLAARRFFDLYSTGRYSLASLSKAVTAETGFKLNRAYLEKLLKNPFYCGVFVWQGQTYRGTHQPLVPTELFRQVQQVFAGHNQPKYRKHSFAFSGLLQCAHDHCGITAELKKGKHIYYHCTGYRGKCALPYFKEQELGERLGQILDDIYIPDDALTMLQGSLREDRRNAEAWRKQESDRLKRRLAGIRSRMDRVYSDRLDGKITEEFWQRRTAEWQQEEQQVLLALNGLEGVSEDRVLSLERILELANKARFLYDRQTPQEKAKLLQMVLSNCSIDAASVYPTYRKPFDLIFNRAKNEEWCARPDSNGRPLVSKTLQDLQSNQQNPIRPK